MPRRLLLIGASGLVGAHALALSLADPRVARVVAPTRRALPAHPKLENPIVDFEALPRDAAWWAADGAVSALGTTIRVAGSQAAFRRVDVDYVVETAALARAAGVRAFALNTALGADPSARNFYLRCKGEAERGVEALDFPALTLVRPALIGGERAQPRPMERLAIRLTNALSPLLPRRYRVVHAERIARRLLEGALRDEPGLRIVESEAI
ncbi:MAG: NAD-dependent dehydratase [Xanthomonadales bacterium]|nr:NAD-dependent dehydratase [Xanthomonadales bacterium]